MRPARSGRAGAIGTGEHDRRLGRQRRTLKLLQVPYRLLYPAAIFFICIGVYSTKNSLFDVGEVAIFGILGAIFLALKFPVSPIVLGFVLGPMLEENFRRTLTISRGSLAVFVQRPISATFLALSSLLILVQVVSYVRRVRSGSRAAGIGEALVEGST